jgi:NAD(P)-dependent dehydrogenase (short-subunit alcohol dehydrogenase family)
MTSTSVAADRWTPANCADLSGLTAVVTGANSGLGFHTSLELARHGARVVMACRDTVRGEEALGQVRLELTGGSGSSGGAVELARLDLASLDSVRRFADETLAAHPQVAVLVNNAGVMAIPRRTTADGFEMQLGTNHLGHFALTGLLLPGLTAAGRSGVAVLGGPARVVSVSSQLHRRGRLNREDLMGERVYRPWSAYGQSKLANLLFMRELHRRLEAAGLPVASLAAHPGYAATNLQTVGPQMEGSRLKESLNGLANRLLAQPAAHGAWPSLRAAGDPDAVSGQYYGPGGLGEQRGHPKAVDMSAQAKNADDARWLWERSVELTGVDYL